MKRYDYKRETRYNPSRIEEHEFGLYVMYPDVEKLLAVVEAAKAMRVAIGAYADDAYTMLEAADRFDAALSTLAATSATDKDDAC